MSGKRTKRILCACLCKTSVSVVRSNAATRVDLMVRSSGCIRFTAKFYRSSCYFGDNFWVVFVLSALPANLLFPSPFSCFPPYSLLFILCRSTSYDRLVASKFFGNGPTWKGFVLFISRLSLLSPLHILFNEYLLLLTISLPLKYHFLLFIFFFVGWFKFHVISAEITVGNSDAITVEL